MVKRIKCMDNQSLNLQSIQYVKQHTTMQGLLMNRYSLRFPAYCDLVNIVSNWIINGQGLTITGIVTNNTNTGNSFKVTRDRVNILLGKGLIEQVGYSKYKAPLYVPTIKAINELQALLS